MVGGYKKGQVQLSRLTLYSGIIVHTNSDARSGTLTTYVVHHCRRPEVYIHINIYM